MQGISSDNLVTYSNKLLKSLLILLAALCLGIVLYALTTPRISIYFIAFLFFLVCLPFLLIYHEFFEKVFVGILLLTLPLLIDKTINMTEHSGGARGFIISLHDIALAILVLLWFYRMFVHKERKIRLFKNYSIPVLGILIMSLLSMAYAAYPMFSVYEFIEIVKMALVFLYLANYIVETGHIRFIVIFLMVGLFIEGTLVVMEAVMGHSLNITALGMRVRDDLAPIKSSFHRVSGTLGGANGLAWYLCSLLPVPFTLFFLKTKKKLKMIILFIFLLGLLSLILTYSRGGWIGFIIGVLIVLALHYKGLRSVNKVVIPIVFIAIVCSSTVLIVYTSNPIKARLTEEDRGSAYSRIMLMEVAFEMIKSNPIIGVGLNNYTEVHHNYDVGVDKITQYYPVPVHNVYLQLTAEIGIPGLLFFLGFIGHIFIRSILLIKRGKGLSETVLIGLLGGITGFLINGFVENSSLGNYYLLTLWSFCGIAVGIVKQKKLDEKVL